MDNRLLSSVSLVALAAGCVPTVLPPVEAPTQIPVTAGPPPGPPPAGEGQVAIDTASGEPSAVEEITGHVETMTPHGNFLDGLTFRTVCQQTPCLATLPLGNHDLRITSLRDPTHGGTGSVNVTEQPTDYRYALGHALVPSHVGFIPLGLGVGAMIVGVSAIAQGSMDPSPSSIATPLGVGALVVGAVASAIGAYLLTSEHGEVQQGTGIQWPSAP